MCDSTAAINFLSKPRKGSMRWIDGLTLKFIAILSSKSMELAGKFRETDNEGFEYVTKYSHTYTPNEFFRCEYI